MSHAPTQATSAKLAASSHCTIMPDERSATPSTVSTPSTTTMAVTPCMKEDAAASARLFFNAVGWVTR